MRIVQVAPTYAPCIGGAERLLQEVSERLAARGHHVTVLTFDAATQRDLSAARGAGLPPREQKNGVTILRLDPAGGRLQRMHEWWLRQRGGWRTTEWLFGPEFDFELGRPSGLGVIGPLLRLRADVVTSVNWHFGVAAWTLRTSRVRRLPHVAVPILHIERPWASRPQYRRLLRHCAATLACTQAEADFLESLGARSVSVAGAGVDPARFRNADGEAIRRRYGISGRPVVGFVGRQDELKGVLVLLEAMLRVWQAQPGVVLLLAGPRAHRDRAVVERLEALTPVQREQVVLADDFADAEGPSILAACDLLAQPSVEEAFGLVLVEAWMSSRPVIAADISASRSLVESGCDGWLVPPGDTESLAGRILDLLESPEQRAAFGARGRRKVLSRYSWYAVVDTWERSFRLVVNGRGSR